jgi:RHS repeat-associated protein
VQYCFRVFQQPHCPHFSDAGKRTKLTYGNSSYSEYLYDGAGRLTVVNNNESDGTDISKFAYVLDDTGLRTKMSISGSAYTSATCVYDYDAAYQLTKDTRTGGSSYTDTFQYDTAGNRTRHVRAGTARTFYYDYIDRMTKRGSTAYGWDYWGNLTSAASHTYAWDDSDRLTKFDHNTGTSNDSTYHYLPGSWKRYKRIQDTTVEYLLYDGDNVVASYASDGTLNALYLTPGLDDNLSMTQGENTYYYFQDGLGSVRNVVDSSEVAQNTYDYRAFGETLAATEGVTSPYRFTAREFESGGVDYFHYYRNRYYNANAGLFASRDAIVGGCASRLGVRGEPADNVHRSVWPARLQSVWTACRVQRRGRGLRMRIHEGAGDRSAGNLQGHVSGIRLCQ